MAQYPVVLNLNGTVSIPVGNMAYVEFDESAPYVDILDGGVVNITDFQTLFGADIIAKIVRCDIWVERGGEWQDYTVPPENITYDSGLLKTIRYTLNAPSGSITKLYGKIY